MRIKKLDELGKPYKIYLEHVEDGVIDQFIAVMEHDAIRQGALMPDAHLGYSLPIGGVVACDGMVFPSYVGFDIGCGLCAMPTTFKPEDVKSHGRDIFNEIYAAIPVGFNVHQDPTATTLDPSDLTEKGREAFVKRKGFRSLGTLGGGNRFIEIGEDEINRVWIIIHSGSRGVGHGIATVYMKLASGVGKAREGNYGLRTDEQDGQDYINDLNWSLAFALANRKEMMGNIVKILRRHCEGDAHWSDLINRNHNHAEKKDDLWIHRKGATHAEVGMKGVIPGNMRDGSFIVTGKGNAESLWSSSHGAGRVLGRKKAKQTLSLDDFKASMKGVVAKVDEETLDESPGAYKDIFEVMRLQNELVEVNHLVTPFINIKG